MKRPPIYIEIEDEGPQIITIEIKDVGPDGDREVTITYDQQP